MTEPTMPDTAQHCRTARSPASRTPRTPPTAHYCTVCTAVVIEPHLGLREAGLRALHGLAAAGERGLRLVQLCEPCLPLHQAPDCAALPHALQLHRHRPLLQRCRVLHERRPQRTARAKRPRRRARGLCRRRQLRLHGRRGRGRQLLQVLLRSQACCHGRSVLPDTVGKKGTQQQFTSMHWQHSTCAPVLSRPSLHSSALPPRHTGQQPLTRTVRCLFLTSCTTSTPPTRQHDRHRRSLLHGAQARSRTPPEPPVTQAHLEGRRLQVVHGHPGLVGDRTDVLPDEVPRRLRAALRAAPRVHHRRDLRHHLVQSVLQILQLLNSPHTALAREAPKEAPVKRPIGPRWYLECAGTVLAALAARIKSW